MLFNKKTWVDRFTEHPNRRTLIATGNANEFDVSRSEGTVTTEGDPFNAQTMNDFENRVSKLANFVTTQLTASGWSGTAPYTQTVNIAEVLENSAINSDVILGDTESVINSQLKAYGMITKGILADGSITFLCISKKPTIDLDIALTILGGA